MCQLILTKSLCGEAWFKARASLGGGLVWEKTMLAAEYPEQAFVFYPPGKQMAVVNGVVREQVQKG